MKKILFTIAIAFSFCLFATSDSYAKTGPTVVRTQAPKAVKAKLPSFSAQHSSPGLNTAGVHRIGGSGAFVKDSGADLGASATMRQIDALRYDTPKY